MTPSNPDDLKDKAHLYHGLSDPPSAHSDPPASVVGPAGLRQEPDAGNVTASAQQTTRAARAAREELSYDTVSPRSRGGGRTKLVLGAAALVGAALAYFFLPKFGFGPGSGHGGTSPGVGGASPNPPGLVQATQPTAENAPLPTAPGVATTAPTAPLQLTIVEQTYHVGTAEGREVSLDEAVSLARSATPGSPVVINLIDTSREGTKEALRSALEQQQIQIQWARNGKPVSSDLPGTGKVVTPGDESPSK